MKIFSIFILYQISFILSLLSFNQRTQNSCIFYNFTNSINSTSAYIDYYEKIFIQLIITPVSNEVDTCWTSTDFIIKPLLKKEEFSNGSNQYKYEIVEDKVKIDFKNKTILLYSEIPYNWTEYCLYEVNTYSQKVKFCIMEVFYTENYIENKVMDLKFYIIESDQSNSKNSTTIRLMEDYNFKKTSSNQIITPKEYENKANISIINDFSVDNTDFLSKINFSKVRFKLTFEERFKNEFEMKIYKYFLYVEGDINENNKKIIGFDEKIYIKDGSLYIKDLNLVRNKTLIYYKEVSKYISYDEKKSEGEFLLSLPTFPEKFNLIVVFDIRNKESLYTNSIIQDKMSVILNDIVPFPIFENKKIVENPNFFIFLIFLSISILLLMIPIIYLLGDCIYKNYIK